MARTLSHKTSSQTWFGIILVCACQPLHRPHSGFLRLHEGDHILAHLPTPSTRRPGSVHRSFTSPTPPPRPWAGGDRVRGAGRWSLPSAAWGWASAGAPRRRSHGETLPCPTQPPTRELDQIPPAPRSRATLGPLSGPRRRATSCRVLRRQRPVSGTAAAPRPQAPSRPPERPGAVPGICQCALYSGRQLPSVMFSNNPTPLPLPGE